VTESDISDLPLGSGSADVAVFCLALMGLNYLDFLLEARRCLRTGGYLMIAEVLSRLSNVKEFVKMVKSLGFNFKKHIKENTYFIVLVFQKTDDSAFNTDKKARKAFSKVSRDLLSPCIYKKR